MIPDRTRDKREIEARHHVVFDTTFAAELDADALRLTDLGQVFMRNVALPFDHYYAQRKARGGDSGKTFSKTL